MLLLNLRLRDLQHWACRRTMQMKRAAISARPIFASATDYLQDRAHMHSAACTAMHSQSKAKECELACLHRRTLDHTTSNLGHVEGQRGAIFMHFDFTWNLRRCRCLQPMFAWKVQIISIVTKSNHVNGGIRKPGRQSKSGTELPESRNVKKAQQPHNDFHKKSD